MRPFRVVLVVLLVVLALALTAIPVVADAVYPSQHVALAPAADIYPLRSGFVENIHANGPIVYAHENYVLNGALADTTFSVHLMAYADTGCTAPPIAILDTGSITTNRAGNAKAEAVFSPADVAPFRGMTVGAQWVFKTPEGAVAYRTECSTIVLD